MEIKNSFLGGALKVGGGEVFNQACSFVRNIILARLISPENFGIAATFAMTFSLMEMASNVSVQTLLVQAPDGDGDRFESTGHLLLIWRGIFNAILLLLLAAPLSTLFGVPQARWAFYWVAAIPLLKGFVHLDLSRFQRHMRFTPQVAVDTISSLLVTLLAWPLAARLHDYSAMLWLLLLQAVLYTVGSRLVAERPYHWSWDRDYLRRYLSFGWPLLINGLLMYGILQGDKFVIGASRRLFAHSVYTLADLGIYSVTFAVTMAPSALFSNVASSLILPLLARWQRDPRQFTKHYRLSTQVLALSGLLIAIPFIVAGGWIMVFVFGQKYAAAGTFVGWLGAMWGVRVFRLAPTQAALALGDSRNSMIANIARTTALIGVVVAAATGRSLAAIAACAFFGEVLATAVCIWRLSANHRVPSRLSLTPLTICGAGIVLSAIARLGSFGWITSALMGIILAGACVGGMLLAFADLRENAHSFLQTLKRSVVPAPAAESATF